MKLSCLTLDGRQAQYIEISIVLWYGDEVWLGLILRRWISIHTIFRSYTTVYASIAVPDAQILDTASCLILFGAAR